MVLDVCVRTCCSFFLVGLFFALAYYGWTHPGNASYMRSEPDVFIECDSAGSETWSD